MNRKVVFSPRAERHLHNLHRYILDDAGLKRADLVLARLVEACGSLSLLSERGVRRDDLFPGLRVMGYRRQATIAFTIEPHTVTIHGVLWRGQDVNTLFDDGE